MLVIKMFDPILGVDIHMIVTPAGVTLPLPHPFVGIVWDVFAWLPFIGTTVFHAGIPTAQAGTSGKAVPPHIPIGGVFPVPPGNEAEIFMGSSTVLVDGAPLAFQGVMVLSCQTVGMPAPPRPFAKKKARGKSLFLPTSTVLSIPAGKPVLVGGAPTIDVMGMVVNLGMAAGGKFFQRFIKNSNGYKRVCAKVHDAARTVTRRLPDNAARRVHNAICTAIGHPVDVATGKVYTERLDFHLPGPIPLIWNRVYYSVCDHYRGPLGAAWYHGYDQSIAREPGGDSLRYRMSDGRNAYFLPIHPQGTCYLKQEQLTLSWEADQYVVTDADGLRHHFDQATVAGGGEAPLLQIERHGASIDFDYNDRGYLHGIVDSAGRALNVHNDSRGRITRIDAPHPKHAGETFPIVRYEYDALGDLIASYDQLDYAFTYKYYNHLLKEETNRTGLTFHFEYAELTPGRSYCTRTWGSDGIHANDVEYDLERQLTTVTNSLGHTTRYYYNELGLVTRTVDPRGHEARTRFTDSARVHHEIDELGRLTGYAYDADDNPREITYPDGTTVRLLHENNRPVLVQDQNGGSYQWTYDERGRVTERRNPAGETTGYEYTDGNLTTVIDTAGNRMELSYDAAHNLIEVAGANAVTSRYRHDRLGRPVELTGPTGVRERRQYNLRGDLIKSRGVDGNVQRVEYDGEENPVHIQDNLREVRLEYKDMSRLGARTENGTRVEFKYDTEEDLVGIINEHGYAYKFGRDPVGKIISESGFDGLTRRYERDAAGQVTAVVRPGGRRTQFELDRMGRTTEAKYHDGSWERFEYRADGELLLGANAGAVVRYERDKLGRVTQEQSGPFVVESKYDKRGNRVKVASSLGAEVKVGYDDFGGVTSVQAQTERKNQWRADIERNPLGQEVERSLPGGVQLSSRRDASGRLNRQRTTVGGAHRRDRRYDWGQGDRLKSLTLTGPSGYQDVRAYRYEYDAVGNLAAATYPDRSRDYRLPDAIGNLYRTPGQKDREYGPAGQLLRSGKTYYEYDAEGNLTKKSSLNEWGGPSDEWRYRWSANGTLAGVLRPDGDTVTFTYDALGRRLTKHYRDRLTTYVYDGNVLLHQWDTFGIADPAAVSHPHALPEVPAAAADDSVPNNPSQATPNNPPATPEEVPPPGVDMAELLQDNDTLSTWVFDPGGFAPMARVLKHYQYSVITDHLGTPTAVYDQHGEERYAQELDIYGGVRSFGGDPAVSPFRYPGQVYDGETGLCYNRFRYYDPGEGFYISQDPIGLAGGNPTLYGYVGDVNLFVDIFGLACTPDAAALDRLEKVNPVSIAHNKEMGGLIYKQNGKYFATPAVGGTVDGFVPKTALKHIPKDAKIVGDYHTHGDYSREILTRRGKTVRKRTTSELDEFNSDSFSRSDIDINRMAGPGHRSYLGTPSGQFKVNANGTIRVL